MIYTHSIETIALVGAAGVLGLALLTYLAVRKFHWKILVATAFIPFTATVIALGMYHSKVEVTDTALWRTAGIPPLAEKEGFVFAEVTSVEFADESDLKGRERRICKVTHKNGETQVFSPGDLWSAHHEAIAQKLKAAGVEVVGKP